MKTTFRVASAPRAASLSGSSGTSISVNTHDSDRSAIHPDFGSPCGASIAAAESVVRPRVIVDPIGLVTTARAARSEALTLPRTTSSRAPTSNSVA